MLRSVARARHLQRIEEHGILHMEKHCKGVFVGDIHGDLMVLLAVLEECGAIYPLQETVRRNAFHCHIGDGGGQVYPMSNKEMESVRWNGGSMAVVLLGDVLDNRRGAESDEYGVCALPGTQQTILSLIYRLRRQAMRCGGRLIWVLGNHCCGNVTRGYSVLSSDYAPRYYVTRSGSVGRVAHMDSHGSQFSSKWRALVLHYMDRCEAVAVLLVQVHMKSIAVAMHGFPTFEFGQLVNLKIAVGSDDNARSNVRKVNQLYHDFLHEKPCGNFEEAYREHSKYLPTWCRATKGDKAPAAPMLYNCKRVIKAHDPHTSVTCHGDVCFADMAMSRAFRPDIQVQGMHRNRMGYIEMDENGAVMARHFSAEYRAQ